MKLVRVIKNKKTQKKLSQAEKCLKNPSESQARSRIADLFAVGMCNTYLGYLPDQWLKTGFVLKQVAKPHPTSHRARFWSSPFNAHIKGIPHGLSVVTKTKSKAGEMIFDTSGYWKKEITTHVPFVSIDADRHDKEIAKGMSIEAHARRCGKIHEIISRFPEYKFSTETNPKNGSTKFYIFNLDCSPFPLEEADELSDKIDKLIQAELNEKIECFPSNRKTILFPLRREKVNLIDRGEIRKTSDMFLMVGFPKKKRHYFETHSCIDFERWLIAGTKSADVDLLTQTVLNCGGEYKPELSQTTPQPSKTSLVKDPTLGDTNEPCAFKRQSKALFRFACRIGRVPDLDEALAFIQANKLYGGFWEDGEKNREMRVCSILEFMESRFDPKKCRQNPKSNKQILQELETRVLYAKSVFKNDSEIWRNPHQLRFKPKTKQQSNKRSNRKYLETINVSGFNGFDSENELKLIEHNTLKEIIKPEEKPVNLLMLDYLKANLNEDSTIPRKGLHKLFELCNRAMGTNFKWNKNKWVVFYRNCLKQGWLKFVSDSWETGKAKVFEFGEMPVSSWILHKLEKAKEKIIQKANSFVSLVVSATTTTRTRARRVGGSAEVTVASNSLYSNKLNTIYYAESFSDEDKQEENMSWLDSLFKQITEPDD